MSYQDGLRQSDVTLDPIAALRAPTTTLLGVTEPSRAALAAIGLQSVFDLATSPLFALAYEVGEALQGRGPAALARFDTIPGGRCVGRCTYSDRSAEQSPYELDADSRIT